MYDYIIIGGGITGITLCNKLKENGIYNILVMEEEDRLGGLCKSLEIDGHNLDTGGGHFFHTKYEEIFDYVFSYMPKDEFNYYLRVSKIELENQTIDYPIESNIWQLPLEKQLSYLISIVRNGEALEQPEPRNYEEWIRWKLGNMICDNYMVPYNEKLWGISPEEMDIDWLYKIPQINVEEAMKYSLKREADVNKFPAHIHFYYPKRGGVQRIIDALAYDMKENVLLNSKVSNLKYADGYWIVNKEFQAKKVINTTPWNDLYFALEDVPAELEQSFRKICYNRIVVSLYEKEYTHDWHWRYIPDMQKLFHREFFIHNFSENSKDNGIYLETNLKRYLGRGKINYDGKLLYEEITKAAYPIPVIGHAEAIKNILLYYKAKGLYGVGRWGQHEYQNADVSMHEAFQFVKEQLGS